MLRHSLVSLAALIFAMLPAHADRYAVCAKTGTLLPTAE
jgi:hypothetical protein